MREYDVSFMITFTDRLESQIDRIDSLMNDYGVKYVLNTKKSSFSKTLLKEPLSDQEESFCKCSPKNCHTLDKGYLYTCSWIPWIYLLNNKYGTNYPTEEGKFNIYQETDGWELENKLHSSFSNCKWCCFPGQLVEWANSKKTEALLSDWVIE